MDHLVAIGAVARELGMSTWSVRRLADDGVIPSVRSTGGHRRFRISEVRVALASVASLPTEERPDERPVWPAISDEVLSLSGLEEDEVWKRLEPAFGLEERARARSTINYAFTEMLNNAIDHSQGEQVRVRIWRTADHASFEIADDGLGAFRTLRRGLGLADDFAAVQELTKGKSTTQPARHSGEGIFFTSKVGATFSLTANGIRWTVDNLRDDVAVGSVDDVRGTVVRFAVDPDTEIDVGDVFRRYSDEDSRFVRTSPRISLFEIGVDFVSRSEAKRLLAGMERFREIDLDFTGVESVGQAFVDEVFRVWPSMHADSIVRPLNMNDAVRFMVERGLPSRRIEPN